MAASSVKRSRSGSHKTARNSSNSTDPGLDRDVIVATALRLMDKHGVEWLSMRKLASELGVSAPALYWHFPNKDALAREVAAAAGADLETLDVGRGTPRRRLERFLHGLRQHFHEHPSAIALGRRFVPAEAGTVTAQGVALLEEMGFRPAEAEHRYRALFWIVLGFIYVEDGVKRSVHHTPTDTTGRHFQVLLPGPGQTSRQLDTDVLFRTVVKLALDGLRVPSAPRRGPTQS